MKCPICNQEMIEGKIKNYEMWNPLSPATMKFVPNDKSKKSVKADHFQTMQGFCCEKCNKIMVIASIQQKWSL